MLHQDRGSWQYSVLLLPAAAVPPCPAMGNAVQRQQVAVLRLYHVSLHGEAILGDEAWLREREGLVLMCGWGAALSMLRGLLQTNCPGVVVSTLKRFNLIICGLILLPCGSVL